MSGAGTVRAGAFRADSATVALKTDQANGGGSIGESGANKGFGDVFLTTGKKIDFGVSNYTLTHSTAALTVGNAGKLQFTDGDAYLHASSTGNLKAHSATNLLLNSAGSMNHTAGGALDVQAGASSTVATTAGSLALTGAAVASLTATTGDCSVVASAALADAKVTSTLGCVVVDGGEAAADAVELKSSNAAGGVKVTTGTGGLSMESSGNGAFNVATAAGQTGAVNIGSGDAARTITIGNTNTTTALVLKSGSGKITTHGDLECLSIANLTSGGAYTVTSAGKQTLDSTAATGVLVKASHADGVVTVESGTGGIDVDSTGEVNLTSSKSHAEAVTLKSTGGKRWRIGTICKRNCYIGGC